MTKSNYLSSAAKYFAVVSALILLPNLFSVLGSSEQIASLTGRITTLSFYLIIAVTYVALNGEGIAYRKNNIPENLRKIVYLKRYLLFSVLVNFSKNFIERKALNFTGNDWVKMLLQFSSSILFSLASFSFMVTVVWLWYIKRDKGISQLFRIESVAVAFGVLYNVFKIFNHTVTVYDIKIFGRVLTVLLSNQTLSGIFCVACCTVFIIAFIVVSKQYDKLSFKEEEERKKLLSLRKSTKDIYNEVGFGIDTVEDDFILKG